MKMKNLLLITILTVLFTSCNKDYNILSNDSNNLRIEKYNFTKNIEAKKLIYSELKSDEKYKIWINHFDEKITYYKNNSKKTKLIVKLKSLLVKNIFINNSKESRIFKSYSWPIWLNEAKNLLSDKEIYELAYETNSTEIIDVIDNQPVDCFCHVGNQGYSCKTYTVGFPTVVVNIGICVAGASCNGKSNGCGLLFLESCNGANCSF
jgi:hypothetical protein